jgi:hypothetical protein
VLKRKGMNPGPASLGLRRWFFAGLGVCGFANVAFASTISFGGQITQATPDGTGPAANNPGLNNIQDLQPCLVTIVVSGSIIALGGYDLTGASLTFSDPTAPASETSFGSINLTITANSGFDEFSLLTNNLIFANGGTGVLGTSGFGGNQAAIGMKHDNEYNGGGSDVSGTTSMGHNVCSTGPC